MPGKSTEGSQTATLFGKGWNCFGKKGNPSERDKLVFSDAIIRSKLIYGLESAHLTETLKKKIDVFHRKGLRQIMKVLTTFGQKENGMEPTNDNVMLLRMVNAKINTWEARKKKGYNATGCLSDVFRKNKEIIYMSDYYETRRREFLVKVINSEPEDPIRKISMEDETLVLREYAGKKMGGATTKLVEIWYKTLLG